MKKIKVQETLLRDTYISEDLGGFVARLMEAAAKAPAGAIVRVESDAWTEYGDGIGQKFEVFYYREETDEEFNERKAKNDALEARRIADAKKLLGIKD